MKTIGKRWRQEYTLLCMFAALFIVLSILTDSFLGLNNMTTMLSQLPELLVLSLAMMVVILTGGIDLSLMAVCATSGIVAAIVMSKCKDAGYADVSQLGVILLGIVTALVVACLCGCVNGYIISKLGVTPILATLGMQQTLTGLGNLVSKGSSVSGFPSNFLKIGSGKLLGLPILIWIAIIITLITWILLSRTSWGRSIYMLGSNKKVAKYSGIDTIAVNFKVYLFSGILTGIAAIMLIARYNSGKTDLGSSYLMKSISVAVLGGTKIVGGHGSIVGLVLAGCIFQVISSGFKLLGVSAYVIDVILGGLLLVVLTFDTVHAYFGDRLKVNKRTKSVQA